MGRIGITTTIPQEIIRASGNTPVDLNNVFVMSERRDGFLSRAHRDGYPRTVCPWIAGIYGTIREVGNIDSLIVVTQGDCSNTHALAETLEDVGLDIIPFAYPYDGDPALLKAEMFHLANRIGADWDEAVNWFEKLKTARELAWALDDLTWLENKATGFENHRWLVSTSDFEEDVAKFVIEITAAIDDIASRKPLEEAVRLGYIGVPPIFPGIYNEVEKTGARIVFNETQRQFSLPFTESSFVGAYTRYTYPQSVFKRIADIKNEIQKRKIDGILHYTQTFCFRQIEDLLFRRHLDVPILTVEGESNFELDERTIVRLEAFIKMLKDKDHH